MGERVCKVRGRVMRLERQEVNGLEHLTEGSKPHYIASEGVGEGRESFKKGCSHVTVLERTLSPVGRGMHRCIRRGLQRDR